VALPDIEYTSLIGCELATQASAHRIYFRRKAYEQLLQHAEGWHHSKLFSLR